MSIELEQTAPPVAALASPEDVVPALEAPSSPYRIVIKPQKGWLSLNLAEIWRYRDLLSLLVWRDFSSRYRQSILGVGWAIVRPVLSVLVFTVIFGMVAKLPSDGIPYPLFSFAAMMPWLYFANALTNATNSVVVNGGLLTKVYFPRVVLPLASVASGLADLGIQFVLLLGLMFWYGVAPGWTLLVMPLFVLECMVVSLALGLWLTALNVKYRDVGHLVPFLVQIWMYMSPIVYASSLVPERWRALYSLNPMVGVIDGFRWAVLGQSSPDWQILAISFAVVLLLFVTGLFYFRRVEETFADII